MTELWNLCCSQGHHARGTRASRAGQVRWHSASAGRAVGLDPRASPSPLPSVNTNPVSGRFGELRGEKGGAGSRAQAHPQHQHPHVCHSQVDLGALAVAGGVQTDPVHLQLPGHVQQLNI